MACSSGNSITSSQLQNSGSEGDLQMLTTTTTTMDERKRKRMASNRESARRSRMRKQKHLDDLMAQADQLRRENNQILQTTNVTTQQYVNVEAENSVLKAQMNELSQRLQSLNDILNYMNTLNGINSFVEVEEESLDILGHDMGDFGIMNGGYFGNFTQNNNNINNVIGNPWNLGFLNQPIMASSNVLQY